MVKQFNHLFRSTCFVLLSVCFLCISTDVHCQELQFVSLDPILTGVEFSNKCIETPHRCIFQYDYFYNGGGVAIADFNNDDLPDLFFTGNDVPNRIYFNEGGFRFRDVSERAGISGDKWYTGVTVVDINNDGYNDIYLSCSGPDFLTKSTRNELYINNRNGTFSERAKEYGIDDNGLSTQAVFFDMDRDGDLDLWVLNHAVRNLANSEPDWINAVKKMPRAEYERFCNSLYRNDDGHFINITDVSGIQEVGFGLGIAVSDFNQDGLPDVYVCNDYFIPDKYYINQGNGIFRDRIRDMIPHCSFYSMGCDAADINNDGWTDLCVLDMTPADHYRNKMLMGSMNVKDFRYLTEYLDFVPQYMYNTLQLNEGLGMMADIGQLAGVHQSDWSWAPLLADFDNDGKKDLYITNGYKRDVKNNDWKLKLISLMKDPAFGPAMYFDHLMTADVTPIPNQVYRNTNGMQFQPINEGWNMKETSFSNGAAYGDLDGDGDLDLVVNNLDQPAFIYRNDVSSANHWIRLKLHSKDPSASLSNSRVAVYSGELVVHNDNIFQRGYQSYCEPVLHVGLGEKTSVDSLVIRWGNGKVQRIDRPKIDRTIEVEYSEDHLVRTAQLDPFGSFSCGLEFANMTADGIQPRFYHEENKFDDFEKEVLLPHRQSMLGPGMAVADVNGDGLEDFFIGNAKGKPSVIYYQYTSGVFVAAPDFLPPSLTGGEILGAAFFDANGDGAPDLYLARGGGGEFSTTDSLLSDVLLINDTSGHFKIQHDALPLMLQSTKVVLPFDYDNDGDMDVFVGGRNVPGAYPLSPASFLLKNDDGIFSYDAHWPPEYSSIGMITGGCWLDWNGDGQTDLVLVGEWTPLLVFLNTDGVLKRLDTPQLDGLTGWWSSIAHGDFDEDGDEDVLLGNLGWNNKFHPSVKKPLEVYANDFDDNGTLDIVLSKYYKDHAVPVRGRECSSVQMPGLAQQFPTYDSFASSSLDHIYDPYKLRSAYHLVANSFSSLYLENLGNGQYREQELPVECQVSPINSFVVKDLDGDHHLDIVVAGNNTETEVETIPYDAGKGIFMKGKGDGTFSVYSSIESTGLYIPGDVKLVLPVSILKGKYTGLLVAKNNSRLGLVVIKPARMNIPH